MAKNIGREALILKKRRKELGLTQTEIAEAIGVQLQHYQMFEYGTRKVSTSSMILGLRLCAALELAIYLDTSESVRSVTLRLFPGTPAEAPSLPSIPQDADHVRLLMYAVRLNPGAESLTERDWYDYREDRNVCGYCRCILGKCKVTEMLAQLAQITAEMQEYNDTVTELTNKVDTLQTEVDDIIGGIVEIGSCGENIHYVLYENGKLLLHGTGETYDYEIGQSPFWENEDIRSLVVSDGITKIGNSLFERCKSMASASFPTSLTEIGERAFFMYNQGGITSLSIPPSVTTLGEKAFVHFNGTTPSRNPM